MVRPVEHLQAVGLVPRDEFDATGCVPNAAGDVIIATSKGRLFNVSRPTPDSIDFVEVCHHLSLINRFGGATRYPYSVAQHSICCAVECKERHENRPDVNRLILLCLLHDAAEAYCGDIVRDLKRRLSPIYSPIEAAIQNAIWKKLGLEPTAAELAIVKAIDNSVLLAEARELLPSVDHWDFGDTVAAECPVAEFTWRETRVMFATTLAAAFRDNGISPEQFSAVV